MKQIFKLYHFLYVQLYLMNLKRWGVKGDHNFVTNAGLLVVLLLNISTLAFFFEMTFSLDLISSILRLSKFEFLAVIILWFFLQLFYFSYKERYKSILLHFDIESKLKGPKYYYPGTFYMFGSLFLYFIIMIAAFDVKNGS